MTHPENGPLKACPFCGGAAHVFGSTWWRVCCRSCDIGHDGYLLREMAVAAWNRRALPEKPGVTEPSEAAIDAACEAASREVCVRCDGCGWYEGGKTIKTTCEKCGGTGEVPREPAAAPLPLQRDSQ